LIDSNQEIKEYADRLYYDQYRYVLKLRMRNFSCLRDIRKPRDNLADMSRVIADRFTQRVRYSHRFINYALLQGKADNRRELDDLLDMLAFLWPVKEKVKLIFSGDWGYLYSNNKGLLQKVIDKDYVQGYYIKEAVVDRPRNTIVLKSSPYRFRSFLREQLWTLDDKNRMLTYLENQPDIKIGRGFHYWLKYETRWMWTRRYHHFDHNDAKIELMLQLICPGIIRTTMPIIEVNS
jgi:hypothetical protein